MYLRLAELLNCSICADFRRKRIIYARCGFFNIQSFLAIGITVFLTKNFYAPLKISTP